MKRIENVCYLRDDDLEGVEVGCVRTTRHIFPKHAHEGIYAIGLMEQGGSWCLDPGNEKALVAAGELALINAGQVHSGIPYGDQSITYRMVYIERNRLAEAAGDICERCDLRSLIPGNGNENRNDQKFPGKFVFS